VPESALAELVHALALARVSDTRLLAARRELVSEFDPAAVLVRWKLRREK
jgi:hypothetical protein